MKIKTGAAVAAALALTGCSQGNGDDVQTVIGQLSKGDGRVCQNQAVIDTIDRIVNVRDTVWRNFQWREPHIRDQWETFLEGYQADWSLLTLESLDKETKTATCAGKYSGRFEGYDGYETVQQVAYTVTATVDGADFVVEVVPDDIRRVIGRSAVEFIDALPAEGEEGAPVAMLPGTQFDADGAAVAPPMAPPAKDISERPEPEAPAPAQRPMMKEDRIYTTIPPGPATTPNEGNAPSL